MRATRSAPSPGVSGTLGGIPSAVGARPGRRQVQLGDEMYLWILVLLEVGFISYFRSVLSRYHGG